MATTETTVVNTVKTYWKIIVPVAIVALLFSVYFIGTCNGRKNANGTTTVDTTAAFVKKIQAQNAILETNIAALSKQKSQDSIKFINDLKNATQIQIVYIKSQDSAKHLDLTDAVNLMAKELQDTTKGNITLSISTNLKDTLVSMKHPDVIKINAEFITAGYLTKENANLSAEVAVEVNKDSLNNLVIADYKKIINNDNESTEALTADNAKLTKDLKTMTGKYKRQRFFKDLFEGTTLVAVIFAALK